MEEEPTKRARSAEPLSDFETKMLEYIDKAQQRFAKSKPANTKIEIELRLGSLADGHFTSGLERQRFEILHSWLITSSSHFCWTKTSETTVKSYNHDGGNIRGILDGQKGWTYMKKHRIIASEDLHTTQSFSVRIAGSYETELPATFMVDQESSTVRKKLRSVFDYRGSSWHIDTTRVEERSNGNTKCVYEVEFEIDVLRDAQQIATSMCRCVRWMNGLLYDPHFIGDVIDGPPVDRALAAQWKLPEAMTSLFGKRTAFPGSMPINFRRQHFEKIFTNDYAISEKTDGIRFILRIFDNRVWLVTRAFDETQSGWVIDHPVLAKVFSGGGGSMLDGELVRDLNTQRLMFLVFDVIMLWGSSKVSEPFSTRVLGINEALERYKAATDKAVYLPFDLSAKIFYRKKDIYQLIVNKMKIDPQFGRVYTDSCSVRRTDGVVFIRNDLGYQPGRSNELLKWKFPETWTIDFALAPMSSAMPTYPNKDAVALMASVPAQLGCTKSDTTLSLYGCTIFPADERVLWARDFAHQDGQRVIIAECAFDTSRGVWHYKRMREDKTTPNFITSVTDTLEVIAENVSWQELVYRLMYYFVCCCYLYIISGIKDRPTPAHGKKDAI